MYTYGSSVPARWRTVVVAVLIALGLFAPVGIGNAAPTAGPAITTAASQSPDGGGEQDGDGKICADGKPDRNPANGVCRRDQGKGDDDEGPICADGKPDRNPANGVCRRDQGKEQPPPPQDPNIVEGTPCTKSARACVDLADMQAWLIDAGKVTRGPVPIGDGAPGSETPRGTFSVQWKNRDHRSTEFDNAPMPYAVFFAPGGIAFHQGDVNIDSHGCVRLGEQDAAAFFEFLQVGDEVQVH